MCGIAGIISPDSLDPKLALSSQLSQALHHRGPDDAGFYYKSKTLSLRSETPRDDWSGEGLLLLHRRLSILDLSSHGAQPLLSLDGRYSLVFNGEIYNYKELRHELQGLGYQFVTATDSEVLLYSFAEWKTNCLHRFVGMFAFAIWDNHEESLFLARDPFGIKPLYYSTSSKKFTFASEMSALLECPWISKTLNANSAFQFLRYGLSSYDENTFCSEILQLRSGHWMKVKHDGQIENRPTPYWQPSTQIRNEISFQDASRKLRDLFLESVALHTRSDVPLGIAVSGGIDSSSIACAVRHLFPDLEIKTFSYIPDKKSISEEKWIDIVNQSIGAHSFKVTPRSEDFNSDFSKILKAQGEPYPSASIYAQYKVFELAAQSGVKVVLDGQGADEYLAGYSFYKSAHFATMIRKGQLLKLISFLHSAIDEKNIAIVSLILRSVDFFAPPSLQELFRSLINKKSIPNWINKGWLSENQIQPSYHFYTSSNEVLKETLLRTLETTSLPHLLRYADRNSMAFSIESRVPFLTTPLVEFCLGLPDEFLISKDGTSKAVFRAAMRGIVPDAILDRKDKIGFEAPEAQWFKQFSNTPQMKAALLKAQDRHWVNKSHFLEMQTQAMGLNGSYKEGLFRSLQLSEWQDQSGVTDINANHQ